MAPDDQASRRIREYLLQMLAIPSPTGAEMELIHWLEGRLAEQGFSCKLERVDEARSNLIALRGVSRYLITSHADTVPPWGHPHAAKPKLEGERIYGRGAVDTKGQLAALLWAVESTDAPAALAVFVDEEVGGRGSERFVPPHELHGALVLEPTGLALATSEAGGLELKLEVAGRAAHGAVPSAGINAIDRFFRVYQELKALPFLQVRHPRFPLPKASIGRLEGGIDPQVVPDRCTAQLDVIVLPNVDFERACRDVLDLLETYKLRRELHYEIINRDPPWEISAHEQIVRILAQAVDRVTGRAPRYAGMPAWTDAANLITKGIPAVVFGAGELAVAHTPEEHVELPELVLLGQILRQFLIAAATEKP